MRVFTLLSFVVLSAVTLRAQSFTTSPCTNDGKDYFSFGQGEHVCELRKTTLPLVDDRVAVSGTNGSIEVVGEERRDVALEARVITQAPDRGDAEAMQHDITILTSGTIQAHGPVVNGSSHRNWAVSYRLHVPRRLAATLHTENGGIAVSNIEGTIQADTTNGGVTLRDLAGDVHASTVNGGLDVTLRGDQWQGKGLSAKSTNGGISVGVSSRYSAHLIATTVNGGISSSIPLNVQGRVRNSVDTNLGHGGPLLDLETVNGGVSIGDAKNDSARGEE